MNEQAEESWVDFDHCFICEGPRQIVGEKPGEWLLRRVACPTHARSAVLPNGETVRSFIDRRQSDEYPFEGSLLNYVINPVTIDGARGWADFFMGGPMVLEDVFPSDTYFEHTIQHGRGFLDELYSLYIVRRSSGGVSWAIRRFGRFNTMLSEMIGDWICQGAVDRRLEKKGVSFPVTPDDAVEVLESIGSMAPWHTWPRWMFTDIEKVLINIAKRRFAHLAS